MKKLILITLATMSINASAGTFLNYKSAMVTSTKDLPSLSKKEFATVMGSDTPVCVKDGGKVLGFNQAWATAKIPKSKCSVKGIKIARQITGKRVLLIKAEQLVGTGIISFN